MWFESKSLLIESRAIRLNVIAITTILQPLEQLMYQPFQSNTQTEGLKSTKARTSGRESPTLEDNVGAQI